MIRTAELRTLQAFLTVAQEGSISRAADVLHLTQPAISLQLKRLSEDTGLKLFSRTSRGMELTRDGASLLVKAEKVFAALTDFSQTARRMNGAVRGRLRIGTIVDPDFIRLGGFLGGLMEAFPDLRTELVHGMSGDVISRLLRDQIDVGYFLGSLDDPALPDEAEVRENRRAFRQVDLTRIRYRVIAPAGWDRMVMGKDWNELARLPWIGTPPKSVHARLLEKVFAGAGHSQNQVALVDQEPGMLALVQCGVGLSLCQESIALDQKQSRGLVVADAVKIETKLSFVALKERAGDPNISAALEVMEGVWRA